MAPVERGGDQINNSPEEGEKREREDEGRTQEVFITGPHRLPGMLTFSFFLVRAVRLMYPAKSCFIFLPETET